MKLVSIVIAIIFSATATFADQTLSADFIYSGGDIITMSEIRPSVEAVAVLDGKIIVTGDMKDVLFYRASSTKMIDLNGKTLLPGFIDSHSHISFASLAHYMVDLSTPPVGTITNIQSLQERLKERAADTQTGETIFAFGYDDQAMVEQRHPTKSELDAVSTTHPIIIVHVSGHMLVANSAMINKYGITKQTKAPSGGTIGKDPKTGELNGLFQETANYLVLPDFKFNLNASELQNLLAEELKSYAKKGITLGQEGMAFPDHLSNFSAIEKAGKMPIRVVALPSAPIALAISAGAIKPMITKGGNFSLGGTKVTLDGSPQGFTAYLSKPYHQPPADKNAGYKGYPQIKKDKAIALLTKLHDNGWQLYMHVNGDAASDIYLDALKSIKKTSAHPAKRPVAIHAQYLRQDQLDDMVDLGVIPSFFNMHTYYWGDLHASKIGGPIRGANISALNSAKKRGIPFTLHSDAPVVPMEPLRMIWSAVTRKSSTGKVYNKGERVDVMTALKALTINGAYQYGREDTLGSLDVGKFADMVILSANPLKTPHDDIKDIKVKTTIVGGKTVYNAQ